MPPYTTNLEHLHHELYRLDLLLEKAIQKFRVQRDRDRITEFQGLYISDDEIDRLIFEQDEQQKTTWAETQTQFMEVRAEIQQRVAETQTTDVTLRLPYLQQVFDLSPFETDLLILALAPLSVQAHPCSIVICCSSTKIPLIDLLLFSVVPSNSTIALASFY